MSHRRALERIGHGDRNDFAGVVQVEQIDGVLSEARFAVVEDEVENGLGVVASDGQEVVFGCLVGFASHKSGNMTGPVVEGVGRKHEVRMSAGDGWAWPMESAVIRWRTRAFRDMGLVVVAVGVERGLEVVEGGRPITALAVDGGKLVVGAAPPFVVPCGLVQGAVGGVLVAEPAMRDPEVVVGFAGDGVGMAASEAGDGGLEVVAGLLELATTERAFSKSRVAAGIARVAGKRLVPVGLGVAGWVAVLLEVLAGEDRVRRPKGFRSGAGGSVATSRSRVSLVGSTGR